MDKSFMVFMAIGIGGLYYVTNAVQNIQDGEPSVQSEEYKQKHKFDEYQRVDSIGQDILDVTGIPIKEQIEAWDSSILREDALSLFPDFGEMKVFIEERVRGEELKSHLNNLIANIESDFFSGKINAESAKRKLSKKKQVERVINRISTSVYE